MDNTEYFDVSELAKPALSPDDTLSYLERKHRKLSLHLLDDTSSTSHRLTDSSQVVVDHGWIDSDTIWYVTSDRARIEYIDLAGHGSPDRNDLLGRVNDTLFDFVTDDQCSRLGVLVRDGFEYTIELYTNRDVSSPMSRFHVNKYFDLVSWDRNSERLLTKTVDHTFSHQITIFDAETDTRQVVTDRNVEARYDSIQWGPDDEELYLVTDYDAEHLYAARLDPEKRDLEPLVEHRQHNVESLVVHPSGRVLYVINDDGESIVYVGELDDGTIHDAHEVTTLPSGVAKYAAFESGGTAIAIIMSTETVPSCIYRYDVEDRSVRQWVTTERPIPRASSRRDERISDDVRYESSNGREIPALFSLPATDDGLAGAIVDVHGGPESQRRPQYRARTRWFLDQGFAVLEPNIRGSIGYGRVFASLDDGEGRLNAVTDVACGIQWIRSCLDCDPVIVCGQSYGGLMALVNSYRHGDLVDGVISEAGIYDLKAFIRSVKLEHQSLRTHEYGTLSEFPDLFEMLSPLCHADSINVPTLIVHGTEDKIVRYEQAPELVERIAHDGTYADLLLLEGEGHSVGHRASVEKKYDRIQSFLERIECSQS